MNKLCLCSWSLHHYLGPITISWRGPDGTNVPHLAYEAPLAFPLLEFPRRVKEELGITAVEIMQLHMPEKTPKYVDQLRNSLDDAGVELVNFLIDTGNIADPIDQYREEDLAEIEEWIGIAAALGSKMVRVNASPFVAFDGSLATLETVVASFRRLVGTAQQHGVQLLLENHDGITLDPDVCVHIFEAVGSPPLGGLIDTGNFDPVRPEAMAALRERRDYEDVDDAPLMEAIKKIAPFGVLAHVRLHGFRADGRHKIFDYSAALEILRDSGFTGPLSIEYDSVIRDASLDETWSILRRGFDIIEKVFATDVATH